MSDNTIRELERRLLGGDLSLKIPLERAKQRAGLSQPHRLKICDMVSCAEWGCDPFNPKYLTKKDNIKWNTELPAGWVFVSSSYSLAPFEASFYYRERYRWEAKYAVPEKWYIKNILEPSKIQEQIDEQRMKEILEERKVEEEARKVKENLARDKFNMMREKDKLPLIEESLERERNLRVEEYFNSNLQPPSLQESKDSLAAAISIAAANNKNIREILNITRLRHSGVITGLIKQESLIIQQAISAKKQANKQANEQAIVIKKHANIDACLAALSKEVLLKKKIEGSTTSFKNLVGCINNETMGLILSNLRDGLVSLAVNEKIVCSRSGNRSGNIWDIHIKN